MDNIRIKLNTCERRGYKVARRMLYKWIVMQRYQLTNEGIEKTTDIVWSLRRAGFTDWAEIGEIVTDAGLLGIGMVMGSIIRWIKI